MQDLPKNQEELNQILQERAEAFARIQEEDQSAALEQYLICRIGVNERYGIPYRYVDEIINPKQVTSLPCVPEHIAGVVNRRSELLTVLNPMSFFKVTPADTPDEEEKIWVVVLHVEGQTVGMQVDEVIGVDFYSDEALTRPMASSGVSQIEYIKGLINGEVTLINIPAILNDDNLVVNERVF